MTHIIVLVFSFLLLGQASFAADAANLNEVVASIGNRKITLKEFNQRYGEVMSKTINPPTREAFLEDLVRYEMGVQEAEKKHLENDPQVKEMLRQDIYKGLLEKELGDKVSKIKVGEEEMKAYYQKFPELRTSHILIEFKPDANEEQKKDARKRAEEILREVKTNKRSFEENVALYTDDVLSKKTGGDVGWQSNVTLVPPYYDSAASMKVGEVRGLITTQYGFHIIKLTGRHAYVDANKRQIQAAVFDQKRKVIFDDYFAKLKKNYTIKENKIIVK
jgi:parvulin-like peptidyl-prolyl isomerase